MPIRLYLVLMIACLYGNAGVAQSDAPSVAIGTHVLILGMSEQSVLSECRKDFHVVQMEGSQTNWVVEKAVKDSYSVVGLVAFKNHQLSTAYRELEVEETSAKSLFYALATATKSLERQGFTDCKLNSSEEDVPVEGGAVASRSVNLTCGPKRIQINLVDSDATNVESTIYITEWIGSKQNL